ncbi:carbohydrate-binding module family 48 protein [Aaosphaeria arxii CBS 175.79]|uniref:Carbohydrate-binding module family 48 protein n=1 Tax=Aaosphaeria arxii CBS 175.79 TaxID=1450172 RepID=A0A6A5XHZ3_9PLEO|nr:carbohydrate-binding module family 48 protein [Aaosphaeria arxii CBS 175.79]KAF2012573.1 carbohydrate-binding module family 48 protein [Aaosphaeria arxii CBS 175.79]
MVAAGRWSDQLPIRSNTPTSNPTSPNVSHGHHHHFHGHHHGHHNNNNSNSSSSSSSNNPNIFQRRNSQPQSQLHGNTSSSSSTSNQYATTPTSSIPPRELTPAHPRRRESIQALTVKASAAPPSASFESAAAQSTSTSLVRPHSRSRSQTIATTTATAITAAPSTSTSSVVVVAAAATATTSHQSQIHPDPIHVIQSTLRSTTSEDKMGNEQSRPKTQGKDQAGPPKDKDKDKDRERSKSSTYGSNIVVPVPAPQDAQQEQPPQASQPLEAPQSQQQSELPALSPQTTQPVDVPAAPREEPQQPSRIEPISVELVDPVQDYFVPQPSQYSRPPRLPLPIEEEPHTPGSPIISPADIDNVIDIDSDALPRRAASVLSSTKDEEEEMEEEFQPPAAGKLTVPTLIEWEGPGERVYVTGTFANWDKKYRLYHDGPSKKKDVLSAMVNIAPGTHHLTFLVDNDMKTSDKLPTAVDYTNSLVNYLEVSHDDLPKPPGDVTDESKKTDPTPTEELRAPPGIYPPQILPPTPELVPVVEQSVPESSQPKAAPPPPAPEEYHMSIPYYLVDLDATEETERFARANAAAGHLPTPPTLPMFLSKSILNGTTPMKDDSSVLIMPNHTVLNHLATSSIKDNILATSATTRYRQKFLTTIMYKPKNEDPDQFRE